MGSKDALLRALRAVLYVCAGVLPALVMASLSVFFLAGIGGESYGQPFILLPWLGTIGLILATVYRPSFTGPRLRIIISILLMFGLLAILPMVAAFIYVGSATWTNEMRLPAWLLVFLGPMLIALHYCLQVAWFSNVKERFLLGLLAIVIVGPAGLGFYFTAGAGMPG